MRRNDPRPVKGQLIGLYLEDKTWGLGQIVNEPNWTEKFGFTIDCDVVGFKHVKVASLDDIDLQTIPLEKKDIVFLITSNDRLTTNVNRVKRDKHREYTLLLPFVRPVLVDETETRRYDAMVIKGHLGPSTGYSLAGMLNCYFCLSDWPVSLEDPERNFAVRFNPNIRPPNAKLRVPKPLFNPGEMPSLFCFFFDTKEGLLQAKPELESMGYRFFEKKKEGKKYMLLMSRFVKLTESCDELDEILGPVAEKWGGIYDGMFEV